jgi:hypothetical protein
MTQKTERFILEGQEFDFELVREKSVEKVFKLRGLGANYPGGWFEISAQRIFHRCYPVKMPGQLLGATILGVQGDEAIHTIAALMYASAPYETLRRSVHIHPTVAELLPTVVGSLEPLGTP